MRKAIGLRTEIIVNLSLLLGAALLFSGFLLLKFAERELLVQRIASINGTMEMISRLLPGMFREDGNLKERIGSVLQTADPRWSPDSWQLLDRNLALLEADVANDHLVFRPRDFMRLRYAVEPEVQVHYPLAWLPFADTPESYAVVTVPLRDHAEFAGALQARFSLTDLRERMANAYRWMLLFAAAFGTVMTFFGIYLLNRNVVRHIRRLQQGTRRIAAGELDLLSSVEGPSEIADLGESFNAMIAALKKSREETGSTIHSLRRANEELRQARGEVIRSEKMASVGHLAAGMAHEIGNPLGAIVGYLEFLRNELAEGVEKDVIERSLAETRRIDRLVRDLLDYSAPGRGDAVQLDPAVVLDEAVDMLVHQGAFAGMNLDRNLPPFLSEVRIVRHKLQQVFVNLLLNARDASMAGGTIRVDAGEKEKEVWLTISDEGEGIREDALPHIFDPFYTTKPPDRGKGLGLSVCHRIIEEAGGRIEACSNPGKGSTFTVWLKKDL